MSRSRKKSSRLPPCSLRNALGGVVICAALGLAGCGNTCFVGFVNNGSGSFLVTTANSPQACSLSQSKGAVRTVVVRTGSCERCTDDARVEHVYVTLRSIQLHAGVVAERDSPDWIELAPELAEAPRQMDLLGGPGAEVFVESAMIPAGSYRQVRMEFVRDLAAEDGRDDAEGVCGAGRRNCVVMADGRVETVQWTGDVPEVLIRGEDMEGGAVVVLPDMTEELRISVEPGQVFSISRDAGWAAQAVLAGRAAVLR